MEEHANSIRTEEKKGAEKVSSFAPMTARTVPPGVNIMSFQGHRVNDRVITSATKECLAWALNLCPCFRGVPNFSVNKTCERHEPGVVVVVSHPTNV